MVAIRDINPAAPTHVLVIPRKPIPSLAQLEEEDAELAGRLLLAVRRIAEQEGLAERGYRVVINTGDEGGRRCRTCTCTSWAASSYRSRDGLKGHEC